MNISATGFQSVRLEPRPYRSAPVKPTHRSNHSEVIALPEGVISNGVQI